MEIKLLQQNSVINIQKFFSYQKYNNISYKFLIMCCLVCIIISIDKTAYKITHFLVLNTCMFTFSTIFGVISVQCKHTI